MKCWIFVFNPLERYMANYKHIFDAWEEGGVRGIVVGRMFFMEDDGERIPAFPQDPQAYADLGLAAPEEQPRNLEKERELSAMLDDAAGRGWHIMVFDSGTNRPRAELDKPLSPSQRSDHRRAGRESLRTGLAPRRRAL